MYLAKVLSAESAEDKDDCLTTTSSSPTRAFSRFKDLPLELRFYIFNYSLPPAHRIKFGYESVHTEWYSKKEYDARNFSPVKANALRVCRKDIVPMDRNRSGKAINLPWTLLAVDREARRYAKQKYYFAFQNKLANISGGIYIDFERDTLVFDSTASLSSLCCVPTCSTPGSTVVVPLSRMEPLSYCAEDVTVLPRKIAVPDPLSNWLVQQLSKMPNLKQVDFGEYWRFEEKLSRTTLEDSHPMKKRWTEIRDQVFEEQTAEQQKEKDLRLSQRR
jgi:hypothetical protein